jgi:hypothetical protein
MDRTDSKIDKPLANACSLDVPAHIDALRALGEKHAGNSLIVHICKTLPIQLRNFPDYVPHPSATHDSQPLGRGKIMWQLEQLEAALLEARRFRSGS